MFATLKGLLVKFFLILIILSFVIWGIGDVVKSMRDDDVAKIGDKSITILDFRSQLMKEKEYMQKSFGTDLSDAQLKQLGFDKYIINKMIQKNLLLKAAGDFGFKLSDTKIAEMIQKDETFHDSKGNFNRNKFNQFITTNHLSELELSNKLNEQYITKILIDFLSNYQFEIKDYEKILAEYYFHKRDVDIIKIKLDSLPLISPGEDSIRKFYDENHNLFMRKEARDFNIAIIDSKKIENEIKITDDEIKQVYEQQAYDKKTLKELKTELESKIRLNKLEQNIEQIKNEIEDLIAGGASFESLAGKFNLNLKNYQNILQDDTHDKYMNYIIDQIFIMNLDSSKEIFFDKANNQYVVIELIKVDNPKAKEFAQIKDQAKNFLIAKQKKDLMQKIRTQIVEEHNSHKNIKAVINKYHLEIQGMNIGRNDLSIPANIPGALIDELFSIGKGEVANINTADQKNFYIGIVKNIVINNNYDAAQLAKIKEQLQQSYKNELVEQYIEYLKDHYKVKINTQLLDRLFN